MKRYTQGKTKANEGETGAVYDQSKKEHYHNKRHRCTCRDTGILLPNCRQGQLLPDAVFLSAQLYLYRPVRCLGALRPSSDRAKAGVQVYDGHRRAAHHLDGSPFGEVFYILAAGCRPLLMVSVLDAANVEHVLFEGIRPILLISMSWRELKQSGKMAVLKHKKDAGLLPRPNYYLALSVLTIGTSFAASTFISAPPLASNASALY